MDIASIFTQELVRLYGFIGLLEEYKSKWLRNLTYTQHQYFGGIHTNNLNRFYLNSHLQFLAYY